MEGEVMNQTKTQHDDTAVQREAFEKDCPWFIFDKDHNGGYLNINVHNAFRAYQAALSRPAASAEVVNTLRAVAVRYYCQYVDKMGSDACLGWEQKVKTGQFNEDNLKAHQEAHRLLGKHQGINHALSTLPAQPRTPTIKTDNTQALYNALERIKRLEAQLSSALHDRDVAEKNHARIAADNMRLKERIVQL